MVMRDSVCKAKDNPDFSNMVGLKSGTECAQEEDTSGENDASHQSHTKHQQPVGIQEEIHWEAAKVGARDNHESVVQEHKI